MQRIDLTDVCRRMDGGHVFEAVTAWSCEDGSFDVMGSLSGGKIISANTGALRPNDQAERRYMLAVTACRLIVKAEN